jgi:tellurite resistance protein TerC
LSVGIAIQSSGGGMQKPIWAWAVFFAIVLSLLILDLGVFHKKQRDIGVKESLVMSGFYITIAMLFGIWVWYATGFLVEKSLSLDNIFVISLIFNYFNIPNRYQHRVLFWGILGVIILRAIMIGLGAQLVHRFEWILYVFAAFLILTGIKMFFASDDNAEFKENFLLRFMRKHFSITQELHGQKFFVRLVDPVTSRKKLFMTPLFLALVLVEFADVVFAVDSIPAIFTITTDTYIVYTSNIFAILGLRALYFALAAILDKFHYLKYSLAAVLVFIGSKVFLTDFFGLTKFPPSVSLGVTFSLLLVGVVYSLYKTKERF